MLSATGRTTATGCSNELRGMRTSFFLSVCLPTPTAAAAEQHNEKSVILF